VRCHTHTHTHAQDVSKNHFSGPLPSKWNLTNPTMLAVGLTFASNNFSGQPSFVVGVVCRGCRVSCVVCRVSCVVCRVAGRAVWYWVAF
jgi:hypothetical protein